jgi:hypothetical protein
VRIVELRIFDVRSVSGGRTTQIEDDLSNQRFRVWVAVAFRVGVTACR